MTGQADPRSMPRRVNGAKGRDKRPGYDRLLKAATQWHPQNGAGIRRRRWQRAAGQAGDDGLRPLRQYPQG
jgi:hypothetical protein